MAIVRTKRWEPAEHLESEKDRAAFLEAALEYGDPVPIAAALVNIARVQRDESTCQMKWARSQQLIQSLSPDGNPEFSTVLKVVRTLGLRLHATSVDA